jgi:hypothetical protein
MADAQSDAGVEEVAELQEETSPCMPHLTYSASELDARYPPLVAPEDDGLEDLAEDRRDGVFQHGLGIAEEIRAAVAAEGRRRMPGASSGAGASSVNNTTASPRLTQSEGDGAGATQSGPAHNNEEAFFLGNDDTDSVSAASSQTSRLRRSNETWSLSSCRNAIITGHHSYHHSEDVEADSQIFKAHSGIMTTRV